MHGVNSTLKFCLLVLVSAAVTASDSRAALPRTAHSSVTIAELGTAASQLNPSSDHDVGDSRSNALDFGFWSQCITGPGGGPYTAGCEAFDTEPDGDVDLRDTADFQQLPNDSCATPITVGDGITAFSNMEATTDGPDEPDACNFFDYTQLASDVWFCYQATCSGEAVVSLCGSNDMIDEYDSKMAVYAGCGCPTTSPIACNDDGCRPCSGGECLGVDSRLTFQAQAGASYLIRIGGFHGSQGDGIVTVRCAAEPCGIGQGACSFPNGTPGCEDVECCNTTCAVDPFCCDVLWDQFCAEESAGLCSGFFPACQSGSGACGIANGTPGCEDAECCNAVCFADPYCCVETWDEFCAVLARGTACFLACGGQSGGCFIPNGTPGCDNDTCCRAVCTDDPFCCEEVWDDVCADSAASLCR